MNERLPAAIIAKEAAHIFVDELGCESHPPIICGLEGGKYGGPRGEQHYALMWVSEDDLSESLDSFSARVIRPLVATLRQTVPPNADFGLLELPKGVDSASGSYGPVWLRCVIDDKSPTRGKRGVWARPATYYDVQIDQFVHGMCGVVVRLDMLPVPWRQDHAVG